MKMMMVRFSRTLVDGGASGKFDCYQPVFFEEGFDVPVNRGDSHAIHLGLRRVQDLLRRERPVGAFESLANGGSLPGVPLVFGSHFLMIARYRQRRCAIRLAKLHRNGSNVCASSRLGSGNSLPAALLCAAHSTMSRY